MASKSRAAKGRGMRVDVARNRGAKSGHDRTEHTVSLGDNELSRVVFGEFGVHLTLIEKLLGLEVHARGNELTLVGTEQAVRAARRLLEHLGQLAARGHDLGPRDVERAAADLVRHEDVDLTEAYDRTVLVSSRGRPVRPKSVNQARYVQAIRDADIVFAIGPAGTGKTYLAMAVAVSYLQNRLVKRLILTRPAVEAGERLGFLPGSMLEKVNPYLRPLYDALNDMIEPGRVRQLIEEGAIEVAPLAFMRGRTLNDSFVVLDEAQNTTTEQMKMFLTRLGFNSKAVITGDVTQTDLPAGKVSGLEEARRVLSGIDGIVFCEFTDGDVVRHPLVQKIIQAYEVWDRRRARENGEASGEPPPPSEGTADSGGSGQSGHEGA